MANQLVHPSVPMQALPDRGSEPSRADTAAAAPWPGPSRQVATSDGPWSPAVWLRHSTIAIAAPIAWHPQSRRPPTRLAGELRQLQILGHVQWQSWPGTALDN